MTEVASALLPTAKFPQALDYLFAPTMPDGVTPVRYRVGYGGRGGGKTENYARALLLKGAAAPERYLCAREYQNSIKQSVHKTIADQITALEMNYLYEVQQNLIKHREIPTEFIFEGLHGNIDRIKSYARIKTAWIEEGQSTLKDSFEKLDPTIREPGSEIWVSFNPELETDFMYDYFVLNPPPDALVRKLTYRDNPWFPEVLRRLMETMKRRDFDAYLNVWEGEPKLLLAGAVYAEELRACRAGGRICDVPYDPRFPVDTHWDLGRADKTAIWFTQQVGFESRVIDYYENQLKGLDHYLEILQARRSRNGQRYVYGKINLPHDAKAKQLGTKLTIEEQLVAVFGRRQVVVVPKLSKADGINAVRMMFPTCYFDKKLCHDGLTALSHYCYEIIDDKGRLSREPKHDEHSHGADAFRYYAVSRKIPKQSIAAAKAKLAQAFEDAVRGGEMYEHGGRPSRGPLRWMGR